MKKIFVIILTLFCAATQLVKAQTDVDGLMMQKNFFCIGPTYSHSTWKNYWEGTLKRDNQNLGTVTTNTAMLMGNYGITDKLNVLFGVPYVKTKASAGQLAGQKGFQDASFFIKYIALSKKIARGQLDFIVIGGATTPMQNYTPDMLPLSIGLKSATGIVRLMADYQKGNFSATASGAFNIRGNVTLDRQSYYTTEMHYSNKVAMPNTTYFNLRTGYRSSTWIIEGIAEKLTTQGGFDISRNNMPFVSNRMNATRLGIHVKYDTDFVDGLSFLLDGSTTVAGRNVGETNSIGGGIFYILDFTKKKKEETTE
jgi:hypothetical protein